MRRALPILPLVFISSALVVVSAEDGKDGKAPSTSPEPRAVRGTKALEDELAREEAVARVSSGDAQFAALCRGAAYAFDLAEPEGERSGELAQRGYELADRARRMRPERAEGHYRYALCLGIYLREHSLSALTRFKELIAAGKRTVEIDERYDRGGGHRFLATLYAEAPGFMGGDKDLARKHLARLLEVAGDDEENKLVAVSVHLQLGEKDEARAALARVHPENEADPDTRRARQAEVDKLKGKLAD